MYRFPKQEGADPIFNATTENTEVDIFRSVFLVDQRYVIEVYSLRNGTRSRNFRTLHYVAGKSLLFVGQMYYLLLITILINCFFIHRSFLIARKQQQRGEKNNFRS